MLRHIIEHEFVGLMVGMIAGAALANLGWLLLASSP